MEWSSEHSDDALDSRWIIDNLPKVLFLFTILFSLPRYFWDSYVGGSLKSYLQYMLHIIDVIKSRLEKTEQGFYGSADQSHMTAFDKNSELFTKNAR